jgi:hypothetical protein
MKVHRTRIKFKKLILKFRDVPEITIPNIFNLDLLIIKVCQQTLMISL